VIVAVVIGCVEKNKNKTKTNKTNKSRVVHESSGFDDEEEGPAMAIRGWEGWGW